MKVVDIVFFVIAIIIILVAIYYLYRSKTNLQLNPASNTDPDVTRALSNINWALWIAVVGLLFVIGTGALLIIYGDRSTGGKKALIGGMLFITFVVSLTSGIFVALGANKFRTNRANTKTGTDSTAQNSAITAAVLLLGVMPLLLMGWGVIYFIRKPVRFQAPITSARPMQSYVQVPQQLAPQQFVQPQRVATQQQYVAIPPLPQQVVPQQAPPQVVTTRQVVPQQYAAIPPLPTEVVQAPIIVQEPITQVPRPSVRSAPVIGANRIAV